MFKRIFVLHEGSTGARQGAILAERIARVSGGTVMLSPEVSTAPTLGISPWLAPLRQERAEEAGARGRCPWPSAAEAQGGPETGRPGLFEGASALESDLMLITGPGCAGLEPWMLVQVAQRAASYPPVPVLILRAGATALSRTPLARTRLPRPPTVAVALDGSQEAEAAILPAAHLTAALAAPARGSLHLTRVVLRPDVEALLQDRARIDPRARDQIMREAIDYLHQMTNELHAPLEEGLGLTLTWSVALDSDVVNALVETAEQGHVIGGTCPFGGCDLLALATHSRDTKGYWMPGNVTGRLFTSTNLPLFLV